MREQWACCGCERSGTHVAQVAHVVLGYVERRQGSVLTQERQRSLTQGLQLGRQAVMDGLQVDSEHLEVCVVLPEKIPSAKMQTEEVVTGCGYSTES